MDNATAALLYMPAAQLALQAFPITVVALSVVAVGENITFRVDADNDAVFVLRLHRPGYHSLPELVSERIWMRALDAAGIAVPAGIATRDGDEYVPVQVSATNEQRYAGLGSWTAGEVLQDVLARNADAQVALDYFGQLGAIIARLHNQASTWQVPADFTRHSLDAEGFLGDAPFWGPFWEHPVLSDVEKQLVLATRGRLREALHRYGREPATFSLIHADLHPGNLLLSGEQLTVIDFDDAGFGWHVYDIAVALNRHRRHPNYAALEQALLEGYAARRELPPGVRTLLPMFFLIRGLATLGWIHQRPEHDGPYVRDLKDELCVQCSAFIAPC